MNPEFPNSPSEPLEARITSFLLGELNTDEAAVVRHGIEADPRLRALHAELKLTMGLVREALATPASESSAPQPTLQLPAARREQLLQTFREQAPAPAPSPSRSPATAPSRVRMPWYVPMSIAAILVALLGSAAVLPGFWRGLERRNAFVLARSSQDERSASGITTSSSAPGSASSSGDLNIGGTAVDAPGQTVTLLKESESLGQTVSADTSRTRDFATIVLPTVTEPQVNQSLARAEHPSAPTAQPEALVTRLSDMQPESRRQLSTEADSFGRSGGGFGGGGGSPANSSWFLRRNESEAAGVAGAPKRPASGPAPDRGERLAENARQTAPRPASALPALESREQIERLTRENASETLALSYFNAPSPSGPISGVDALEDRPAIAGINDNAPKAFFDAAPAAERDGRANIDLFSSLASNGNGNALNFTPVLGDVPSVGALFSETRQTPGNLTKAEPSTGLGRSHIPDSSSTAPSAPNEKKAKANTDDGDGLARLDALSSATVPTVPSPAMEPQLMARYGLRPGSPGKSLAPLERKLTLKELTDLQKVESDKAAAQPPPAPIPQPEVQTHQNPFSTFSLNVSDVSFKLAATSLEHGVLPAPGSIRSEEFINAFNYADPEPARGRPIAFHSERARYPFAQNRDLLRLSVKTAAEGRQPGRPLNLVLLLDNSGSMERADRQRIVAEALRVLTARLQAHDRISVVTFARTARLRVDGLPGDQAREWVEQLGDLTPQGGTNLEDALDLAYQTALRHHNAAGINRVVLLTDGAANLGNVSPDPLQRKVESHRRQGIALDCFGIGWDGLNDSLLEVLSRHGDGRYGFLNSPEETVNGFAAQLAGALRVAATDVKVQIEFNPRRVTAYRQMGYARHQLTTEQFRDNTVDAAELGAAESGNALYVIEVNPAGQGPIATARARYREPGTSEYHEHEWIVPFDGPAPSIEQSAPSLRLAATAGSFAEWLAQVPYASEVNPTRLLTILRGVPETYGADTRPRQLESLIQQAQRLSGR